MWGRTAAALAPLEEASAGVTRERERKGRREKDGEIDKKIDSSIDMGEVLMEIDRHFHKKIIR